MKGAMIDPCKDKQELAQGDYTFKNVFDRIKEEQMDRRIEV